MTMQNRNILKRLQIIIVSAFVGVASIIPALLVPGLAQAATCNDSNTHAISDGTHRTQAFASTDPIDSSATKVGIKITPVSVWQPNAPGLSARILLANTDCSDANASLTVSLDANGILSVALHDGNHSGSYVEADDFIMITSGVTWSSSSDTDVSITYATSAMSPGFTRSIFVDLDTFPGYATAIVQMGDTVRIVGSMKLSSGITTFLNENGHGVSLNVDGGDPSWDTCSSVAAGYETQVQVWVNNAAIGGSLRSTSFDQCPHLNQSSYDGSTKTLNFKYITVAQSGVPADVSVIVPSTSSTGQLNKVLTSLDVSDSTFTDFLNGTNSASQQLYFIESFSSSAQGYSAGAAIPIAAGVFDMSTGNHLDASDVIIDSSLTTHSAVAHNFAKLTTDNTFTLFVPYHSGDQRVAICPGAASLQAVNASCNGLYYLTNGQSKTHSNTSSIPDGVTVTANIVNIDGSQYWQISGLTGTGGFSSLTVPGAPETGFGLIADHSVIAGTISLFAATLLVFSANLLRSTNKHF